MSGDQQNSSNAVDIDSNLGIAVTSTFILCITMLIGIVLNLAGLNKLKKNLRSNITLVQLLMTALLVSAILVPLQIARTILMFFHSEFIILCQIQHFFHLHADSCTFVTLVIITFERLQKIYKCSPLASGFTHRKLLLLCCSWMVALPAVSYIVYTDSDSTSSISVFTYDCSDSQTQPTPIVEYCNMGAFILTLIAMTTMYCIAIFRLNRKMSARVDSMYPNMSEYSATPITRLQPREATFSFLTDSRIDYQNSRQTRHQSLTNCYTIPSMDSDDAASVAAINYEHVLCELKGKYCERKSSSDKDSINMTTEHIMRLRKLSETFQNQSRVKAKSSIANALGHMSHISLFALDAEVEQKCNAFLNPLKHTRRSAGNVWHENETNTSMRPQSIKKKKKMPRKLPKLKKQASVDSIGTFSDTSCNTSCITTDARTDSDISSITFNTESIVFDDTCSAISVIIEQPEHETSYSRQPSREGRHPLSRKTSPDPAYRKSSYRNKENTRPTPLLLEPGTSCQQYEEEEQMRPRSYSASFNVDNTDDNSQNDESFRKRAFTDSSKTKPKTLPDKSKIRNFRRKIRRKRRPISSLLTPATNQSGYKHGYSPDSCSDSANETPSPRRVRSLTDQRHDKGYSSSSDMIEWSDSSTISAQGSIRMSNSMIDLNSPSHCKKPTVYQFKFVDSMTQTEDIELILSDSNTNQTELPTIHLENNKYIKDSEKDLKTKRNNWFQVTDERRRSNFHLSPISRMNNYSSSPNSLNSAGNYRNDMRQIIKRATLIILSLAISYIPTFLSVILMNFITTKNRPMFLQISRCIQYSYFSIIPLIYVYTNQGLLKSLNRSHR